MAANAAETSFPAMGSRTHVIVVGDPKLLGMARSRVEELEARWSRFRPDSELSALNAADGAWCALSPLTFALVSKAVLAWDVTGGLFDPTILPALEAAGYVGSFAASPPPSPTSAAPEGRPAPGCTDIEFDGHRVRLPRGVRIDLGGIGKGFAADVLVSELIEAGAHGVCVNMGGDLRVSGAPPDGVAWTVAVADEANPQRDRAQLALSEGAVATSTRLRRRWQQDGQHRHHLIDPTTGTCTHNDVDTVSVIAAESHWAEVLAKSALVAGVTAGTGLLHTWGVAGLLVTEDGAAHPAGPWKEFVAWTPNSIGTSPGPAG
ncbi:FAD:protein FMN transferase [Mycolicibacterium mucogenicum]|uniref:FAD:protein FMN transferase n=1 Tax=Mycolicibacterium mucogenicum TaxID=56689 RepID=UPI00226A1637|nr:FAD:protein FMN transferase [Mycolicibacterium mucogenicum]MCX8565148.1 FAD:protein FMN transferase [Mycolicibacterium mucogenicum]